MRSCKLSSGAAMPVLGLGTWRMGESPRRRAEELDALKYGLDLGYPMIDTAEMYGEGSAEEIVGEAIAGRAAAALHREQGLSAQRLARRHGRGLRAQPQADGDRADRPLPAALARRRPARGNLRGVPSPARGGKDRRLRRQQLRRAATWKTPPASTRASTPATRCSIACRAAAPNSICCPGCASAAIPLMAYSPLDQGGLLRKAPLKKLADGIGCTPAQLAIAWLLAQPGVVTIPKSSSRERVKENLGALDVKLTPQILADLDRAFPPPTGQAAARDALTRRRRDRRYPAAPGSAAPALPCARRRHRRSRDRGRADEAPRARPDGRRDRRVIFFCALASRQTVWRASTMSPRNARSPDG